jgi:hypothetical protein
MQGCTPPNLHKIHSLCKRRCIFPCPSTQSTRVEDLLGTICTKRSQPCDDATIVRLHHRHCSLAAWQGFVNIAPAISEIRTPLLNISPGPPPPPFHFAAHIIFRTRKGFLENPQRFFITTVKNCQRFSGKPLGRLFHQKPKFLVFQKTFTGWAFHALWKTFMGFQLENLGVIKYVLVKNHYF